MAPPSFIMDAIENGYKVPFTKEPPSAHFGHNKSARMKENRSFLDEDIRALERSKAVKRLQRRPKICNPLQVSHPEVDFRVDLEGEEIVARFDSRLLGQAFGNIVKNATEAMEGVMREWIAVALHADHLDPRSQRFGRGPRNRSF